MRWGLTFSQINYTAAIHVCSVKEKEMSVYLWNRKWERGSYCSSVSGVTRDRSESGLKKLGLLCQLIQGAKTGCTLGRWFVKTFSTDIRMIDRALSKSLCEPIFSCMMWGWWAGFAMGASSACSAGGSAGNQALFSHWSAREALSQLATVQSTDF